LLQDVVRRRPVKALLLAHGISLGEPATELRIDIGRCGESEVVEVIARR
jgi:hypothetical protein